MPVLTVSRHFLINIVNVYTVHNKIDENEVYMYAAVLRRRCIYS